MKRLGHNEIIKLTNSTMHDVAHLSKNWNMPNAYFNIQTAKWKVQGVLWMGFVETVLTRKNIVNLFMLMLINIVNAASISYGVTFITSFHRVDASQFQFQLGHRSFTETTNISNLAFKQNRNFAENCIQTDFDQLEQQNKTVKSRVTEEHQTIWAESVLPLAEWTACHCTVAEVYSLLEASVQAKLEGPSRTRQFIKRYFAPWKEGGSVDYNCCDKEKLKILKVNTRTLKVVVFVAYTPCLTLVSSIRMWPGFK